MQNLRNLPPGAIFRNTSGQASVTAEQHGDNIIINATCDSLQNLVFQYEEELIRIRNDTEQTYQESKPGQSSFKWYFYGILTGSILVIIIKK